jgi:hypothetical protein
VQINIDPGQKFDYDSQLQDLRGDVLKIKQVSYKDTSLGLTRLASTPTAENEHTGWQTAGDTCIGHPVLWTVALSNACRQFMAEPFWSNHSCSCA